MTRWWSAGLVVLLSGCPLVRYTIGGAASADGRCPVGQVECGDGCAVEGECDDCPEGHKRCEGECVAEGACDHDNDCPIGQVECDDGCEEPDECPCEGRCESALETCAEDVCACRPGLTRCDGDCVDIRADHAHCDDCGRACGEGELCQDGECVADCGDDRKDCFGACVDLSGDSLHCGGCGELCRADELCLSSECHPFTTIDDCDSCPCAATCEPEDSEGDPAQCCDSPFIGGPVCVQVECA